MTNPWTEITHWVYDGEGKLRLQNNSSGTRTKYCYNEATGWPTQITHNQGATVLASYGLQYDDNSNTVGNLTRVTESDGSQANYGYDELYRLTSETRTGTAPVSHTYEYDLAGNRTKYDGVSATFDAANKQNGQTYDGDGNVTNSGVLTWSDKNRLVSSAGATNQYDATGLLITSTLGTNRIFHIYDGKLLLGELQESGTIENVYTWGVKGPVSERLFPNNISRWYHFGPQGETRLLTDQLGVPSDNYIYSSYGESLVNNGGDSNPFRYGGEFGYYTNTNDGNILCCSRWYNPVKVMVSLRYFLKK